MYAYESTDIGSGIAKTYDGGYIITGYAKPVDDTRYLWLLRTDDRGDTLWTKVMGGGLGVWGEAGLDVVETPDQGYIIAGYTYSYSAYPGTQKDGWLIKTDAYGDTLWTKTYPGNSGIGGSLRSVQITADGGYILGGDDNANEGDGWMLKTDAFGNELWGDSWGDITESGWDHIICAQPTPDGGCVGFGASYTYSTPSFDGWMLKIDSLPVGIEGKERVPRSNSPIMLSVEPNPFKERVEIKLGMYDVRCRMEDISLKIYDVAGREVRQFSLLPFNFLLTTTMVWDGRDEWGNEVAPGIYFIKVVGATSGLLPITKKLVVIR